MIYGFFWWVLKVRGYTCSQSCHVSVKGCFDGSYKHLLPPMRFLWVQKRLGELLADNFVASWLFHVAEYITN